MIGDVQYMRLLVCAVLTASALSIASNAQTHSPVPEAQVDGLVDSVLKNPVSIDTGFNQHFGGGLGDRLAVAISKRVRLADLRNPDKAKRVLMLLRYAFSAPSFIQNEADKYPGATLLLLDLIENQCPDATVQLSARESITRIEAL